ncbi:MAG: cupredoxin domain-containing protein, partial [Candidatus Rokubacteria bacterium]|nr:cupredoxin domain-containing protein [Candidatus Rokubacteria bacterium]
GAMSRKNRTIQSRRRRGAWKRWTYLVIVLAVGGATAWLLVPRFGAGGPRPAGGDLVEIQGTMGGFSTNTIRAKAGRPLTVRLTSVDTRFHTDGGGKHQFAIDALAVNVVAPPLGTSEATFTPAQPGVYDYYCDVCCGGRANPTMQGKLIVEA